MAPRWRIVVVAVVIFGFGLVMAIHPQDASDIASMARDLKKTLKDVDERLRHLRQLVKALSTGAKKTGSHTPVSPAAVAAAAAESEAASRRFAAQEAYQKGRIEEASQQDAKAIELFTKACELDPANDSAFLHRAFVNYRTGRVDEALSDVNRSLAIQPDNSRAFAFRATVYRTMKDYGRAMADLTEAARRDDRNPEYLAAQAGIEEERGNFSKAVDLYAAAVLIDGQSTGLPLEARLRSERDRGPAGGFAGMYPSDRSQAQGSGGLCLPSGFLCALPQFSGGRKRSESSHLSQTRFSTGRETASGSSGAAPDEPGCGTARNAPGCACECFTCQLV